MASRGAQDPDLSSSSCRSPDTSWCAEDPTTPTEAAILDEGVADAVAVCCLCHVARPPLMALAHQGALMMACQPCWALHSTVMAMSRLPADSPEVRALTDAAVTVYQMAHAATIPPAVELVEE